MKLSVIVIVHNMAREAPRTLRSLATPYQQGIAAEEYEIIVVENGSTERLAPEALRSHKNVRYHYLENALPSPAAAINFGLAHAKGEVVGVMIDGARLCTPGLLRQALAATALHPRTIVATLGFYLGDAHQRFAAERGYDRSAEDALLDRIGWPRDGYRLFEVGVADESSTWFSPMAESNALFMPKQLWSEMGGFDERFDLPGGGFVNLDTFVRACELPDTELVVNLGEATFHQLHGGIATNASPETFTPKFVQWRRQYQELRGKPFEPPVRRRTYLGSVPTACLRHLAYELNEIQSRATGVVPTRPVALVLRSQIYFRAPDAEYEESRSVFARPGLGVESQRVRFVLPSLPSADVRLRLDPADGPALLRLHDLAVSDSAGRCLWRWDGTRQQLDECPAHELSLFEDEPHKLLMVTLGNDSWLELPFAAPGPDALASGGAVELELSLPMASDSMAIARGLARDSLFADFEAKRRTLFDELKSSRAEQRRLFVEWDRSQRERSFLEHDRDRLEAEARDMHREAGDNWREVERLRAENQALRDMIEQINQSLTFKVARPIFNAVNRLRGLGKNGR